MGVHQLHIAIVLFGLFVHHLEDAAGSGQGHQNIVHLLADLSNGLGAALVQAQEGHQRSHGQSGETVQRQNRAHDSAEHIADVSQIGVYGHHDIGNFVGLIRAFTKPFIQNTELLQRLLFMAEHLHHLLALHHFLDVTVDIAQVCLLAHKIFSGQTAKL